MLRLAQISNRFNHWLAHREMRQRRLKCKSRPYVIHLLSQSQCNYNCEFCGFDYRTKPLSEQLTLEKTKIILANLRPHVLKEIVFSGMGEPLLCRDFEEIIYYIRGKFPNIRLSLNTNGELLRKKNLELIARNFGLVIVSMHSLNSKAYAQITGKNSLDQVLENISNLRKENPNIKLVMYFAYTMRNIDEIKDHVTFCHKLGNCDYLGVYAKFYARKRQFSDINNVDSYSTLDRDLSLYNNQEYSDSIIKNAIIFAEQQNMTNCVFPPLFSVKPSQRRDCGFPYTQLMIGPDGQVYPCGGSEVLMYDEIVTGKLNFGNLLNTSINKIWNNKDYVDLRKASRGDCTSSNGGYCSNCSSLGFLVDSGQVIESHFVEND